MSASSSPAPPPPPPPASSSSHTPHRGTSVLQPPAPARTAPPQEAGIEPADRPDNAAPKERAPGGRARRPEPAPTGRTSAGSPRGRCCREKHTVLEVRGGRTHIKPITGAKLSLRINCQLLSMNAINAAGWNSLGAVSQLLSVTAHAGVIHGPVRPSCGAGGAEQRGWHFENIKLRGRAKHSERGRHTHVSALASGCRARS